MKNSMGSVCAIAVSVVMGGCAGGQASKQDVGTLVGGATGALIGSQFGHGSGRVVGAAVGGVGGALVGSQVGKSMDIQDEQIAENQRARAYHQNRYDDRRYGY